LGLDIIALGAELGPSSFQERKDAQLTGLKLALNFVDDLLAQGEDLFGVLKGGAVVLAEVLLDAAGGEVNLSDLLSLGVGELDSLRFQGISGVAKAVEDGDSNAGGGTHV
jgi:hypothetical protein